MSTIETSWRKIRRWYGTNAPSGFSLAEPATDNDIESLETQLALSLPSDARRSYLLYNGSNEKGIFPYGYYMLSLQEIVREWRIWNQGLQSGSFKEMKASPQGPIKMDWWNEKWIPITANGGGDHDCIDMDPRKGGRIGQVFEFSHETGPRRVSASSFTDWIGDFADALEAGKYRFDDDSLTLLPVDGE